MIKIKIECATGAEAMAELLALLGGQALQVHEPRPEKPLAVEPEGGTSESEAVQSKAKRRTKAEIEKVEAQPTEIEKVEAQPAEIEAEKVEAPKEAGEKVYTLEEIQTKALMLSRAGKREDVLAAVIKFDKTGQPGVKAERTPEIDPVYYADYMAELEKI